MSTLGFESRTEVHAGEVLRPGIENLGSAGRPMLARR
ncbi:hypothetical protein AHiyo8_pI66350 (plasmid) [Arthrobacter sp. Hiyo8]|nr:hypothetical protein AHiyo8_pI66350 [Arthrobacter sp. Hiyo8]GAP60859.1 hypothetical protein AHiyo1_44600 [Arthrobacter sp. Hiyo1]